MNNSQKIQSISYTFKYFGDLHWTSIIHQPGLYVKPCERQRTIHLCLHVSRYLCFRVAYVAQNRWAVTTSFRSWNIESPQCRDCRTLKVRAAHTNSLSVSCYTDTDTDTGRLRATAVLVSSLFYFVDPEIGKIVSSTCHTKRL
jgi:hypothetical protein